MVCLESQTQHLVPSRPGLDAPILLPLSPCVPAEAVALW